VGGGGGGSRVPNGELDLSVEGRELAKLGERKGPGGGGGNNNNGGREE